MIETPLCFQICCKLANKRYSVIHCLRPHWQPLCLETLLYEKPIAYAFVLDLRCIIILRETNRDEKDRIDLSRDLLKRGSLRLLAGRCRINYAVLNCEVQLVCKREENGER